MNGYLINFYTEMNQRHQGKPLHEWLLQLSKEMHFKGATVIHGFEGIDHKGKFHSANFFDLVDEPLIIQFALSESETEQLFNYLSNEELSIFYIKTPVEYGMIGNKKGK